MLQRNLEDDLQQSGLLVVHHHGLHLEADQLRHEVDLEVDDQYLDLDLVQQADRDLEEVHEEVHEEVGGDSQERILIFLDLLTEQLLLLKRFTHLCTPLVISKWMNE